MEETTKKLKTFTEVFEPVVEEPAPQLAPPQPVVPIQETSNSNPFGSADIAKKKLDSMFIRHQNQKKKVQPKVVILPLENPNDIDKLMVQYSGKPTINFLID
jgi:hypothetical protein